MIAISRNPVEDQILNEIADAGRKITEIQQERVALERLLLKVRRAGIAAASASRRDSVPRLLIEKEIADGLELANGKPIATANLLRLAQAIDHTLKSGTFRSYLHRMKTKGIITNSSHGYWKLSPTASHPRT